MEINRSSVSLWKTLADGLSFLTLPGRRFAFNNTKRFWVSFQNTTPIKGYTIQNTKMEKMKQITWVFVLFIFLAAGCQLEEEQKVPDVSDIEVQVEVRRFEKALFSIDTTQVAEQLAQLETAYPEFSAIFFGQLMGSKDPRIAPQGHEAYMQGFIQHPFVANLYDTCMILYEDLGWFEQDLEQALKYLKYHFPELTVPHVTTFVSEFSIANFIYEGNALATGLDFFLGEEYPYIKYNGGNPNFSNYLVRTYNRDHMVSKTLKPLVEDLVGPVQGRRLLDYMVNHGKQLYVLEQLLPYTSDTALIEYTPDQLAWCETNELEMWAHFLKEDLLYSTQWQDVRKLVEYSPHSPGMPPEAPGWTGNYLGWQIVKAYMRRHPDASLKDLLAVDDAQALLDQARYRPKG
jgi:hypothetical protein